MVKNVLKVVLKQCNEVETRNEMINRPLNLDNRLIQLQDDNEFTIM